MNSVLQAVAASRAFHAYVGRLSRALPRDAFLTSFMGYLNPGGDDDGARSLVHDPTRFHALMAREARRFGDYGQHDASEFFNYVLDVLERKGGQAADARRGRRAVSVDALLGGSDAGRLAAAAKDEGPAAPVDPFVGSTGSFLTCGECGFESPIRHDRFDHVTLQLPHHMGRQVTVYDLLNLFTLREEVDGVRCAVCTMRATVARIDSRLRRGRGDRAALLAQRRALVVELASFGVPVTRPPGGAEPERTAAAAGRRRGPAAALPLRVPFADEPGAARCEASAAAVAASRAALARERAEPPPAVPLEVRKSTAAKQLKFARLPPVLCLHVSRLMGGSKNGAYVAFPLVLNLAPYAGRDEYARLGAAAGPPPPPPAYLLCAVVVHHGGAYSGHYTIFRRVSRHGVVAAAGSGGRGRRGPCPDLRDSRWVHISDASVVPASINSVLTTEAYMLFYERW